MADFNFDYSNDPELSVDEAAAVLGSLKLARMSRQFSRQCSDTAPVPVPTGSARQGRVFDIATAWQNCRALDSCAQCTSLKFAPIDFDMAGMQEHPVFGAAGIASRRNSL